MNCIKKKALLITAGFLGVGGYILYQNLKTRIDDLEEEIWGMEDAELEVCPYCERVYTIESGINNDVIVNIEEVKYENSNNELHDEVQNHLKDLEEQNKNNNELHDEVQNHLKDIEQENKINNELHDDVQSHLKHLEEENKDNA